MSIQDGTGKPSFPEVKIKEVEKQHRKIRVPDNRYSALKRQWEKIYVPIVERMNLQIRMNIKERMVELRVCEIIWLLPTATHTHTLTHQHITIVLCSFLHGTTNTDMRGDH